jgi:hypothetical protein
VPEAGASRRVAAASLDTEKQLATSVQDWLDSHLTEYDLEREKNQLHRQLVSTVHKIWQDHAARPQDDGEARWWAAYEAEMKPLEDETPAERWRRVEKWQKKNRPTGRNADVLKWEKKWNQLQHCQQEWIGYRAACCGEESGTIAVPIGCNDRLCPLCAAHRSKVARVRIKTMFDRLTHPALLTLTIPNKGSIRKHDFTLFRKRVRQLLAQYKGFILGGVYSLETTFNRNEKTWHIHCHVLCDLCSSLPRAAQKIDLAGRNTYAFNAIKLRMEYDWLRLWGCQWGKAPRKDADAMQVAGEHYDFERWVRMGREMAVKEFDWKAKKWVPMTGIQADVLAQRTAWNAKNRRVVDIRPVRDRDGAAREVLKYITKAAAFCDIPEAVEAFSNAAKGARLIQTFGTWYGAKFDTVFDPEHMDDWGEMKCKCGLNMWERMGVFYRRDVVMDAAGRWHLKRPLDHKCSGTVPRPTIRALDVHEESEFDECLQMERR